VLQWARTHGAKKKKDGEWTVVNACKCAKKIERSVSQIHEELESLSKAKVISYKLTDRSFFFETSKRFVFEFFDF
jgi:hypothetical protein